MNWEKLVDIYLDWDVEEIDTFYTYLEGLFDYEIGKFVYEKYDDMLINSVIEFNMTEINASNFHKDNSELIRKEYALKLKEQYKDYPYVISFAFKLLDGKEIKKDDKRKFLLNYNN